MRRLTGLVLTLLCLIQGTQAIALLLPDQCARLDVHREGLAGDDCPIGCARCLCAGQRPVVMPVAILAAAVAPTPVPVPLVDARVLPGTPRDILHVPKHRDIR